MVMDMGDCNRILGPQGPMPYEIGKLINMIVLMCKKTYKQRVGTSLDFSRPGYTCNVQRINKGLFKFCFHTESKSEDAHAMD
jgi:hypothetical protein